ncbi:hypothetical protein [Streptomyces vinaceus]|uniref:hypothetical protein n=1 Tax=Streptomyces vinaceus TaxID=1960 RepID=UPI0035D84FB3
MAEQPGGQDLARLALRNAIQDARYSRGRAHRLRSRLGPRPGGQLPVLLKVTVAEVADRLGWPVPAEAAVVTQWPKLAGDLATGLIAVHFDPVAGLLSLRGTSPAYGTLGRFRTPQIKRTVNRALGRQLVREIAILPPAAAHRPAAPLPPRAFRHQEPALQDDEQLVIAARRRQAAQGPRESGHLFTPSDAQPSAPQSDLVRARALARARTARSSPS